MRFVGSGGGASTSAVRFVGSAAGEASSASASGGSASGGVKSSIAGLVAISSVGVGVQTVEHVSDEELQVSSESSFGAV